MHDITNSYKPSLIIDLDKIKNNYLYLKNICIKSDVAAVVKANSYGLGAHKIAPVLFAEGCKSFFVATLDEGIDLRKKLPIEAQIYVLSGPAQSNSYEFLSHNLTPVVNHLEQLKIVQNLSLKTQKSISAILHFDIGMNRIGMPQYELEKLVSNVTLSEGVDFKMVMSHLSSSDNINSPDNRTQMGKFLELSAYFPYSKKSLANSSGIFLGDEYHFDIIRPGAALYGLNSDALNPNSKIENPVFLFAPIIQIQTLDKHEKIGYNGTYVLEKNSIVATIPVGYGDGYTRALSNVGNVFVNGRAAKILGRISMDFISIDISDIPQDEIFIGQQVELIGSNSLPDTLAKQCNTIGYEILTSLGNRYDRIYIKHSTVYRG